MALRENVFPVVLPGVLVTIFAVDLISIILRSPRMFWKKHGRFHAMTGALYLLWLAVGFAEVGYPLTLPCKYFVYDTILGLLGTLLAVLAAVEFQHKGVKNVASGTLDEHATVTYGEMIEHSFYQGLNLVQALYLHAIAWAGRPSSPLAFLLPQIFENSIRARCGRLVFLALATCPWLVRHWFPVNKFSDNYKKHNDKSSQVVKVLYRIKKYQYIFYKHFILHGLNISIALNGTALIETVYFRLLWLLLNASYVLEFFLQTLVKKRYILQSRMLYMQHILMMASSLAAFWVLKHVNFWISCTSLALNFTHRKHDFANTMLIALLAACFINPADHMVQ